MKGQASLEYLLVSAVGIGLIGLSLISLSAIKSAMDRNIEISRFRESSELLHQAVLSVCAAGSGNVRPVELRVPLSVRSEQSEDGWIIGYEGADLSRADFSPCEMEDSELEGRALIKNEEGKIRAR